MTKRIHKIYLELLAAWGDSPIDEEAALDILSEFEEDTELRLPFKEALRCQHPGITNDQIDEIINYTIHILKQNKK